ncbi:MAG TPA: NifU family protein [Candidatus Omnitrophota bacterium]|nr:NifU family protein [Candidatus Omnitrophota bacterium]HQL41081.1 NifU family protein [Candidatus Omnitrophota bacterium]
MTIESNPELEKINSIIDHEIRPFLQRDGGDLKVVDFKDNLLTIDYQGACGGCPHAKMGTLMMIQEVLKERYSPEIKVSVA